MDALFVCSLKEMRKALRRRFVRLSLLRLALLLKRK
jgi:hypothetical protein